MADIYAELDDDPEPDDEPERDEPSASPGVLFVCDALGADGEICGKTFDNPKSFNGHQWAVHRDRSKDKAKPTGRPRGSRNKAPSRARASSKESAPRRAAARATPPPSADRASTYASSIAMMALGAYLVVPPFDNTDLDIVNRGAANLADALAQAGAQNQTIQTTCDLILGGGSGGAYIQLLLALSAIVVPICAHHGLVPSSAGARFGEMIGAPPVAPAPPAPAEAGSAPPAQPGQPDFANMGPDEVLQFFSQVPPTVLFDLAGKMFSGVGPDVVDIGGVPTPENLADAMINLSVEQTEETGDSERGSEQLAPDTVAVPT